MNSVNGALLSVCV